MLGIDIGLYFIGLMGNSQPLTQQSQVGVSINHPLFSKAIVVSVSGKRELQITMSIDERQYQVWSDSIKNARLDSPFLLLPKRHQYLQNAFCGTLGTLTIHFDNFSGLLASQLEYRRNKKSIFEQWEMWMLLYGLTSAQNEMKKMKESKVGDIRPQNVFINANGQIKVGCLLSWPKELPNFYRSLQGVRTFISPEEVECLVNGKADELDGYKAQVFSIGLTVLSLGMLDDLYFLYNMQERTFDYKAATSILEQWSRNTIYSQLLTALLNNLCSFQPSKRLDDQQLWRWLGRYGQKIMNRDQILFQNIPDKLKREIDRVRGLSSHQTPKYSVAQLPANVTQSAKPKSNYSQVNIMAMKIKDLPISDTSKDLPVLDTSKERVVSQVNLMAKRIKDLPVTHTVTRQNSLNKTDIMGQRIKDLPVVQSSGWEQSQVRTVRNHPLSQGFLRQNSIIVHTARDYSLVHGVDHRLVQGVDHPVSHVIDPSIAHVNTREPSERRFVARQPQKVQISDRNHSLVHAAMRDRTLTKPPTDESMIHTLLAQPVLQSQPIRAQPQTIRAQPVYQTHIRSHSVQQSSRTQAVTQRRTAIHRDTQQLQAQQSAPRPFDPAPSQKLINQHTAIIQHGAPQVNTRPQTRLDQQNQQQQIMAQYLAQQHKKIDARKLVQPTHTESRIITQEHINHRGVRQNTPQKIQQTQMIGARHQIDRRPLSQHQLPEQIRLKLQQFTSQRGKVPQHMIVEGGPGMNKLPPQFLGRTVTSRYLSHNEITPEMIADGLKKGQRIVAGGPTINQQQPPQQAGSWGVHGIRGNHEPIMLQTPRG